MRWKNILGMKIYNFIPIIIVIILVVWCVVSNCLYNKLKYDYDELKEKKEYVVDSLIKENITINQNISILKDSIITLDSQFVIKLNKIKNAKGKTFVMSKSLTETADKLKNNLICIDF